MISKKMFLGLVVPVAVLAFSFAVITNAQTTTPTTPTPQPPKMVVDIGPGGKTLLRGTINSVATGTISVKSWGGDWTVNVASTTKILPASANNDITKFKAGDFIGVLGTTSTTSSWTVDASLVRDWTEKAEVQQEQKQNQQDAKQTIKSDTARNFEGIASNIGASTFTLTEGTTVYTVNVATGAEVVNRNWQTLPLSSIKCGDTVRVWGTNTSGTLSVKIVRDVSIGK